MFLTLTHPRSTSSRDHGGSRLFGCRAPTAANVYMSRDSSRGMTMGPLDDREFELICPGCGYRLARRAARLRRATAIVCPNCGVEIVPPAKDRGTDED